LKTGGKYAKTAGRGGNSELPIVGASGNTTCVECGIAASQVGYGSCVTVKIKRERVMYGKILVPVDGSETSTRGLNEAIKIAKAQGSQLRLVHIVNEYILDITYSAGYFPETLIDSLVKTGRSVLDAGESAAKKEGVKVDSVLMESIGGVAADLILAQAKTWQPDLIVMGTYGRRGLARLALGSDAEQVVRGATVPVLLVRGSSQGKKEPVVTLVGASAA
jgi:nucleotide-binding universal stress UspA family protein